MFSNSEGTKKMESLCFNIFVSISYAEFQRVDTSKTNVSSGASVSAILPVSLLAPSKYCSFSFAAVEFFYVSGDFSNI